MHRSPMPWEQGRFTWAGTGQMAGGVGAFKSCLGLSLPLPAAQACLTMTHKLLKATFLPPRIALTKGIDKRPVRTVKALRLVS